ncbi:hypothetical protein [Oceanicola sp. 502str15]|uniref:hypothetical protein n=1 Tax=Oceanicola sp. 502str15 TaxID=2696061 RepID=UPI002094964A|nr:hypothetical protein [Oceanicola sp. 502str15]MCO6382695.1 hypothetical protein [Oceanicola sp. 502str15]
MRSNSPVATSSEISAKPRLTLAKLRGPVILLFAVVVWAPIAYMATIGGTSRAELDAAFRDDRPLVARMATKRDFAHSLDSVYASSISRAEPVLIAAEESVRSQLRDPDSATFENMAFNYAPSNRRWFVCGTVNARNGFGGYAGPKEFAIGLIGEDIDNRISFGNVEIFPALSEGQSDSQWDSTLNNVKRKCGLAASLRMLR